MYRRILVPVDGSDTAERGLHEALGLARSCGAGIVLLHVMEPAPVMVDMATGSAWEQIAGDVRTRGQQLLERLRLACIDAGVATESHLVETGALRVCDQIVEQARDRRCDLIVMGTHGRRGLQHALIGSDAERVTRQSPVPVLLVRSGRPGTV